MSVRVNEGTIFSSGQTLQTQESMHCFFSARFSAESPVISADVSHDALDSAT